MWTVQGTGDPLGTNDTIVFDSSVTGTITLAYTDAGDGNRDIDITTDVTITGPGASDLTIDADNASRIFEVNDGDFGTERTVSISGLTLINGLATGASFFDQQGGGDIQL